MRREAVTCVFALAGCGRIAFDRLAGDGGLADAGDASLDAAISDLVVWFPLDEGPDLSVADRVSGLSGQCNGPCPLDVPGKSGGSDRAYQFDGAASDCIVVSDAPVLRQSTFTLSVWVRHDVTQNDSIVAKRIGASVANSWQLETGDVTTPFAPDSVAFGTSAGASNDHSASPGGAITLGEWHHIAATYSTPLKRLYVDGMLVAQDTGIVDYDAGVMTIGCDENGGPMLYFTGTIDEVQLYRRALDASEIAMLAAQ